jgi:hypothetical protein
MQSGLMQGGLYVGRAHGGGVPVGRSHVMQAVLSGVGVV